MRGGRPNELIGQASLELEQVADRYQGWGSVGGNDARTDHAEPMAAEYTEGNDGFSFRDRRADLQVLGASGGTFVGDAPIVMADHDEGSMAAIAAEPWRYGSEVAP